MKTQGETVEWLTDGRVIVVVQLDSWRFGGRWRWMLAAESGERLGDFFIDGVERHPAYITYPGDLTPYRTSGRAKTRAKACDAANSRLISIISDYNSSSAKGWEPC